MKKLVLFIVVLFNLNLSAQLVGYPKLFESAVPKVVLESFENRRLNAKEIEWSGTHISYWFNDYVDNWYLEFYPQRKPIEYAFKEVNFYEATFITESGDSAKALFTKYGFWHETRTKVDELPNKVLKAISQSEYVNWKMADFREKLESIGVEEVCYRVSFSKENQHRIVRVNSKGDIIQVKKLTKDE